MKEPTPTSTHSSCTIRPFEPADRAAVLSLYETVFGRERSTDWFRWKYEDNPYVDHVPIIVAEIDGKLVGCRAFFAQEMRINGSERIAFQPCDTMVHPSYQGQGLFDRMNEWALERYSDRAPTFCFNFPNEKSKPGNLKHGWKEIGTFPVYYRPQDPVGSVKELTSGDGNGGGNDDGSTGGADTRTTSDGANGSNDDSAVNPRHDYPHGYDDPVTEPESGGVTNAIAKVITSSHQAGDRLVTQSPDDMAVVRFETPPPDVLETVYRRSVPDGIHTNRTAEFYRWRFENPTQTYTTYVATRDGETPLAALVLSRVDDHLRIVESLPRKIESEREAINHLLVAALTDSQDRNYVTAFGKTLPTPIRYRFYPDTRFPLSTLVKPTARTLLARDLGDKTGLEESGTSDWNLSRLDLDTT
ncbi:GNAT family N-acetyltransferase [Natronorubrum sp. JWXQ-INN-674]|uniref:GNAT family N-acetyltransferase n=1 Tax=Natronorubrum halalkaliphilum TaxID=2691917 RepID=A0A6B0VM27_9EURY|nr:GNAT family N-acetyltransferase [Natronorubrum halalkaliphilum]MXV62528.1 GNAT family N-acetyltransferase [Natronorubrum halalkaliphilum]